MSYFTKTVGIFDTFTPPNNIHLRIDVLEKVLQNEPSCMVGQGQIVIKDGDYDYVYPKVNLQKSTYNGEPLAPESVPNMSDYLSECYFSITENGLFSCAKLLDEGSGNYGFEGPLTLVVEVGDVEKTYSNLIFLKKTDVPGFLEFSSEA